MIPRDPSNLIVAQEETSGTANGADIHTCGHCSLTLDLALDRKFRWLFIVTDVLYPIIGMEFLLYFDLLVDARHRLIVDSQTSPTATGSYAAVNQITPQWAKPPSQQPYNWLRRHCPGIVRLAGPLPGKPPYRDHRIPKFKSVWSSSCRHVLPGQGGIELHVVTGHHPTFKYFLGLSDLRGPEAQ